MADDRDKLLFCPLDLAALGDVRSGPRIITGTPPAPMTTRRGWTVSRLFVAPATVQSHVVNALIKLGAKNRAHGIALACRPANSTLNAPDQMAVVAGPRREAGKS